MSGWLKRRNSMALSLVLLTSLTIQRASSQEYIKDFSDFPKYPYNTVAYKQGGAFVGCGPTTGAMIFGYFDHSYGLGANGLLTSPVTGVNEGLNTAWVLHGSQYMKTQSNGFGSVYDIKPGLENYADSRGYQVTVMAHASPYYTGPSDPNASWLNDYGPYGTAWLNDGYFWRDSGGSWWIDADDFCDFVDAKLSAGITIFLTIDTDEDRNGDHWVALVGYNKSTSQYAYYDTYSTSLQWADIHYCGAAGATKDNAISFLRSVSYEGSTGPVALDPPEDLMALSNYNGVIPLAWNTPPGIPLEKASRQDPIITERMFNPQRQMTSNRLSSYLDRGSMITPFSESRLLSKKDPITAPAGVMGLQGFDVYRSTAQNGAYTKIAANVNRQYYRDETAVNGQTYYYKLKGIYNTGESSFSDIVKGKAALDGYSIESGWSTSAPTLDGVINPGEWSEAEAVDITYPGSAESVTLYVMNTNSTLYLAVDDSRDNSLDDLDQFAIFFDDNLNREWPASEPSDEGNFWLAWNGGTSASFSLFGPRVGHWPDHLDWPARYTPSGVSQGISIASGHVQYEGSFALNTSPLMASPEDMIGFLVFTYDKDPDDFSSFWPQQAEKLKTITPDIQYWGQAPFSFGDLILASSEVIQPDIIVTDIEIMDATGPDLSYKVTVQNIGTGATTSEFKNRIYLSTDDSMTPDDRQINDWNCYDILAAGQTKVSYVLTSTVVDLPPGEYYIGVIADAKEVISESDETNNTGVNMVTKVTLPEPPSDNPDLIVTDVTVTNQTGVQIEYQYSVQNQGNANTGMGFHNYIYLSADQFISQSDIKIDEKQCNALNASASHNSGNIIITVSGVPAGDYYLGVIADAKEVISESDEGNNTLANLVTKITIPDEDGGDVTDLILEVPMAKMAPVIDGVMDPIWYSACSVPMEKQVLDNDGPPDNWLDAFSSFKMMFDHNNYYLFIKTHDDIINTSHADPWQNDSFEIYFDGDNSKNDLATGYDGNDIQLRYIYGQTSDNMGNAPNSVCQFQNTDNGFNCEIRIPAQDMTFTLNSGHTLGFDIQFNDNDSGERDHELKWWATSDHSWHDASLFGTAMTTDYVAANPMYILQAPSTPIIDGVVDDTAWDNIPWFSDNTFVVQNGGAPLSPPFDINNINNWNDCRFNYKMMWQGSMLYLYADVFDDIIDTGHGDFWMNDGFQIFIDGNNDKTGSPDANDAEYDPVYTTTPTGDVAFTQTASGWTMEMQMNLGANPGISPAINDLMGIDVSLNDNDGGGRDLWSRWWSDDDVAWNNPSLRGTIQFAGLTVDITDEVVHDKDISIQTFHLAQNFPNPFNPSTTIRYTVPKTCSVTLTIYDLLGKEITTLINETRKPGEYSVVWDGQGHAAGIYLYQLKAGEYIETKKLILQK
ncbi:sugar-binding protein [bacterium]